MSLEITSDQILAVENRFSERARKYRKVFQKHHNTFDRAGEVYKKMWSPEYLDECAAFGQEVRSAVGEIMEVLLSDKALKGKDRYLLTSTAWDKTQDGRFEKSEYQPYIDKWTGELFMAPYKGKNEFSGKPVIDKKRPRTDAECVYMNFITQIVEGIGFSREERVFITEDTYPTFIVLHEISKGLNIDE